MATRHTGSRNSLEDPYSNSAKAKKLQENQMCIIMDDETYFKLDCSTLLGQQFYTIPKETKSGILLKAIKTENFGKKVMFWEAICSCGLKTHSFFINMSSEVYVNV